MARDRDVALTPKGWAMVTHRPCPGWGRPCGVMTPGGRLCHHCTRTIGLSVAVKEVANAG